MSAIQILPLGLSDLNDPSWHRLNELLELGVDARISSREKIPDITDFMRVYQGLEPEFDLIPTHPTAHYAMGGIPTNYDAEVILDDRDTRMPGFFASLAAMVL